MKILNELEAILILVIFGFSMIGLVWFRINGDKDVDSFLVADRKVSLWKGSFSIAVSWIWAPAIFICSMQAYNNGLPGIFWFTAPNILCFFIFAPIALRLRKLMPNGYTLPEFIFYRFKENKKVHIVFLIAFLGYQLGAIVINAVAGGTLLYAISGLDIRVAICATSFIALTYSLISGLKSSIFTDVIQMSIVLFIGLVLVPWCLFELNGVDVISKGLGGVTGEFRSLMNPWIAFTMGIPMTLSLIAGPISDQMFYQRTLAIKQKNIVKTFILAGLLFSIVPIALSLLGFIGASLASEGLIEVSDPQVIGPIVISYLLPKAALYAFCLMAFAGLCSTMDSAFCAVSSLGSIDMYKRYINPNASNEKILTFSRFSMVTLAILGTGIALLQPKLLWVFLVYGALASAVMFPTIFSLYWSRLNANGAFWAIIVSLLIATPLSIYANVVENPYLIISSAVLSVVIGFFICLISGLVSKEI